MVTILMIGLITVPAPSIGEIYRPADAGSAANTALCATARRAARRRLNILDPRMAKDTEKLIRQLSLISFLMANRRPVSALEIKREVEGYSSMNEDAFARRFYADRAELESLGISLQVEKPAEGFFEAELYALPPENYYLPAIEFSDSELAALRTALGLLDGEFAYAEPLRLALQQVSWGRPSPLTEEDEAPIDVKLSTAGARPRALAAAGEDRDRDLAPQDDRVLLLLAAARRDLRPQGQPLPPRLPRGPVLFDRPLARARRGPRVPPLADPRQGLLRDQGRARLPAPEDFDRRDYASRADWQMGEEQGHARRSSCASGSPGWSSATSAATARCASRSRATGPRAAGWCSRPSTPPTAS